MGDVARGLAYLCCFCCRESDAIQDGSHFSSKTKPDPREREIDEVFKARNYQKDSHGRFHVQPTPTASMFPNRSRSNSKISTHHQSEIKSVNQVYGDTLGIVVPSLMVTDSSSSDATAISAERRKDTETDAGHAAMDKLS
ncbi:hypothetical protein BJ165DRAFT_1515250 [Panaeolus papilionaceus]|nr:hypothetical protein BJ165DRAFT_1515250 [Panaeolus papilionaceus]